MPPRPDLSPRRLLLHTLLVSIGNTLIAVILALAGVEGGFGGILLSTQIIGFTIFLSEVLITCRVKDPKRQRTLGTLALLFSAPLGVWLASHAGSGDAQLWLRAHPETALRYAGLGIIFGLAFSHFFFSRERVQRLESAMREAELRQAVQQKQTLEAQLKLLQAQIEPHFLFNTLANLHSLIERDPPQARRLLDQLNAYLRASLIHTRAEGATLGDECRMLEAYLHIQAVRMGERLRWSMDVPEDLKPLPFAPMLIQPLVENAIRHGLEPAVSGGELRLTARRDGTTLRLRVEDDGVGLRSDAGGGVGLNNIRQRLAALYGDEARLSLRAGHTKGVIAELCLPLSAPVP